jgi:hypothetical protein
MPRMDWQTNIARWRALPAKEKLRQRWECIPAQVARSMAFEGEPVSETALKEQHARHTPRDLSRQIKAR